MRPFFIDGAGKPVGSIAKKPDECGAEDSYEAIPWAGCDTHAVTPARHPAGEPTAEPLEPQETIAVLVVLTVLGALLIAAGRHASEREDDSRLYVEDARGRMFKYDTQSSNGWGCVGCLAYLGGGLLLLGAIGGLMELLEVSP